MSIRIAKLSMTANCGLNELCEELNLHLTDLLGNLIQKTSIAFLDKHALTIESQSVVHL